MSSPAKVAKKSYSPMQYVHIAITLLLMFGFGYLPPFSTLTPVGMKLLGLFLGVVYGYSTCEVIWPSLFAFIAFGLSGYVDMNAGIASMMGGSTVFQIITQYFTAGAIVIYGFGKWFVRWSLSQKLFKGKPLFYTWCFMFIFMWTSIVISQIPMALLLYAVWSDIADSCGYEKNSSFRYYGFGGILLSLMMGGAMIPYKSWMLGLANTWASVTGGNINLGFMFLITAVCGTIIITAYVFLGAKLFKVDFSTMEAFDVDKLGEESKHLRPRTKRILVVYLITMLLAIFAGTFLNNPLSNFLNNTLTTGGLYCVCSAILMVIPSGEGDGQAAINFNDIKHSDTAVSWPVILMCAVTIPLILVTRTRYAQLCAIADRIAAKDATVIASLAPQQTVQAFEAMKITVGAIVAGGAIPDYEIVGEVVAKRSLSLTEEDAKKMYVEFLTLALPEAAALGMAKEQADATPRHCPSCGAPVTSEGAKFCESCGVRLKGGD